MTRGARLGLGLVVGAIASAAWWLGVLALLEHATEVGDDRLRPVRAGGVLVAGTLAYAAALFATARSRTPGTAAAALGVAMGAGLYWTAVAFFLLGITAGDTRDGAAPDRGWQRLVLIATLVVAPGVFALLLARWRRFARAPGSDSRRRSLTEGESDLARAMFGAALDLARVRIHCRRYLPWQASGVAMTPNGELYFRAEDYKADFSQLKGDAAWLLHELTHAWQYQSHRSVKLRGLIEQTGELLGRSAYHYGPVDPRRAFATLKNEQQAAMVEDCFRLRQHMPLRHGSGSLADYEAAIPFVRPAGPA